MSISLWDGGSVNERINNLIEC